MSSRSLRLPLVFLCWVPEDGLIEHGLGVLPRELGPGRDAIDALPVNLGHAELETGVMLNWEGPVCILRDDQGPDTEVIFRAQV